MPALERAVALPEVDDVAVGVGEDLDLDVPGPVDVLLEVDAAVLEGGLGLVAGGLEGGRRGSTSSRQTRMPLPPPPAAALISTG